MNQTLKSEQAALLIACYLASLHLGYAWWLFFALLLLPDIGMVGYLVNNSWGALLYNAFHHQGLAVTVTGIGWYTDHQYLVLAGIILLGHSAMDRVFGYGLKYASGFRHTHLGDIGMNRKNQSPFGERK